MKPADIEKMHEVQEAVRVLKRLEEKGLKDPLIGCGWVRALLYGTEASDIDVSYVGPVHYREAQRHLKNALDELEINPEKWDVEGIWNTEMAYGFTESFQNYTYTAVCSINSIFLASDGKLHDPTGYGFEDAKKGILRINMHDRRDGIWLGPVEEVNTCLEACRYVQTHNWQWTPESEKRVKDGVKYWGQLSPKEAEYHKKKTAGKFSPPERAVAQKTYEIFGWGFIFDLISNEGL